MSDNDKNGSGDDERGTKKTTTIIVNTRKREVEGKEVSFEQIVKLAFETPPSGENIEITVAYRKGPSGNQSGTMHPGERIKVTEGMIFDVTATDKS